MSVVMKVYGEIKCHSPEKQSPNCGDSFDIDNAFSDRNNKLIGTITHSL